MRKLLIAGNWKMNGSLALAKNMIHSLKQARLESEQIESMLFPSFVHLSSMLELAEGTKIKIGAQNVSEQLQGALTGEISLPMLQEIGVTHVLLGHSERRSLYNESDELIFKKTKLAVEQGFNVIFCVGESLEARELGDTKSVINKQLQALLASPALLNHITIAYEPVWAIGTGKTASPEQAQEVHQFIREKVAAKDLARSQSMQILYGGSVNAGNAKALFAKPDIDGGLVGGASLKVEDFLGIIECIR